MYFSVDSWVYLRGPDFPEISAAVCPDVQKQRSPPSCSCQQWYAAFEIHVCLAFIPRIYSVLCVLLLSWNHAGSWETDGGRVRVPLRPQLPGPLPVDQPTAGRPEEVGQARPVLQDSQHVLRYTLHRNHAYGRLKQEVQYNQQRPVTRVVRWPPVKPLRGSNSFSFVKRVDLLSLVCRKCYSSHGAYAQSKLALVLFTYFLQEQLTASGLPVTVNAIDPGMVDTALYDNLWSLAQAAKKPVAKILFRVAFYIYILYVYINVYIYMLFLLFTLNQFITHIHLFANFFPAIINHFFPVILQKHFHGNSVNEARIFTWFQRETSGQM